MDESDNRSESEAIPESPEAVFQVPPPSETRGRGPGFLFGVLMGVLVGAGLATIFTPVSGEQVRVSTAEKAPELWRRRDELTQETRQKARNIKSGVQSRLSEAMEAGREAARDAQQEARRRYEGMTGRRSGPHLP